MGNDSITLKEIADIPSVLREAARPQSDASRAVGGMLAGRKPQLVATIGRGSSDHAATYLRYAFELKMGIPGSSISPSITSLYGRQLALDGALCLAVSQSGRSPDILSSAKLARGGGATLVAIVNDASSPLAELAHVVVPVGAGHEKAVAATKSFVGSVAAGLTLLATLNGDTGLHSALHMLPGVLEDACDQDIDLSGILNLRTAFVLGRGPALGIAQEAALKLKEIAQFPAEAFSSAEVRHGPWQLGQTNCGLIGWRTDEISRGNQQAVIAAYRQFGHPVVDLQHFGDTPVHDLLAPLIPLPTFYRSLVNAALQAGFDPDSPSLLRKVTETV